MEIIQVPGRTISRPVKDEDIRTLLKDRVEMIQLCFKITGRYEGGLAVAHCQVEYKDPLRFYVTKEGRTIVNPEIVDHTKHTIDHAEGCLSFAHRAPKTVQRWNKCRVRYQELIHDNEWKLSAPKTENLSGKAAKVAQHEIDHLNGINIYIF